MHNVITKAIKLIENGQLYNKDVNCRPVYLFTTENINALTDAIEINNKSILTVNSSSDHIFNMLLKDANLIESYDINIFTKYYFYFKKAAIITLNYNEFIDFFFPSVINFKNKVFEDETFKKILMHIEDESAYYFWKVLFYKYGGKKIYKSNLFIKNYHWKNTYTECNNYLKNETNYNLLKQKLKDFEYKFYCFDIFGDVTDLKDNKYDVIYLSNILDKSTYDNELMYVKKIKEIIMKFKSHLNDAGVLGICYLYMYQDDYWESLTKERLNSLALRIKYFNDSNYIYKAFNGFNNYKSNLSKDKDALMLTLKK